MCSGAEVGVFGAAEGRVVCSGAEVGAFRGGGEAGRCVAGGRSGFWGWMSGGMRWDVLVH